MKFAIGDWALATSAQDEQSEYVGRVAKIEVTKEGTKVFIDFHPTHPWLHYPEDKLALVVITK